VLHSGPSYFFLPNKHLIATHQPCAPSPPHRQQQNTTICMPWWLHNDTPKIIAQTLTPTMTQAPSSSPRPRAPQSASVWR